MVCKESMALFQILDLVFFFFSWLRITATTCFILLLKILPLLIGVQNQKRPTILMTTFPEEVTWIQFTNMEKE